MPFTEDDCLNETLLKVMVAEARAGGDLKVDDRSVIEDWFSMLKMEGPECDRIHYFMDQPIDEFQAELYHNELKASLVSSQNREKILMIMKKLLGNRRKIFPIEKRVTSIVNEMLNDKSGIVQILENLSETKKH